MASPLWESRPGGEPEEDRALLAGAGNGSGWPGTGSKYAARLPGRFALLRPLGERIVRETAAKGSRNYQIVQKLMDRGSESRGDGEPGSSQD